MSRARAEPKSGQIALALTWDGARWPLRKLPKAAREFLRLGRKIGARLPSPAAIARLLEEDQVTEIRVCWVPCLLGGESTLSLPFTTADGRRLRFKLVNQVKLGDHLGAIYWRIRPPKVKLPTRLPGVRKDHKLGRTAPSRKA